MIASIDEDALIKLSQVTLKEYLNSLFEQAFEIINLSSEWPIVGIHQNVITRRRKRLHKDTPILPLPPTIPASTQPPVTSDHYYIQRKSQHDDVTYDHFRQVLLENHSLNEPKYVDMLVEAKELKSLSKKTAPNGDDSIEAGIFWLGFKASVASPREFVELVATKEFNNDQQRSFLVVSIPVDTTNYRRKGHERGKYLSWEYVCEKPRVVSNNDELGLTTTKDDRMMTEWTCVQQSSAGGWLPGILSDWVATQEFHKDVSSLVNFIKHEGI